MGGVYAPPEIRELILRQRSAMLRRERFEKRRDWLARHLFPSVMHNHRRRDWGHFSLYRHISSVDTYQKDPNGAWHRVRSPLRIVVLSEDSVAGIWVRKGGQIVRLKVHPLPVPYALAEHARTLPVAAKKFLIAYYRALTQDELRAALNDMEVECVDTSFSC